MSILNEILVYSPSIQKEYRENIVEKLSRKQAGEGGHRKFFNQYWQPFAWAATIGFVNEKRVELNGPLDQDMFKYNNMNNQAHDILKALIIMAIGKFDFNENLEEEMKLLENPNEIVKIIDEYANGGFEIIKERLENDPDYYYDHNKFLENLLERDT